MSEKLDGILSVIEQVARHYEYWGNELSLEEWAEAIRDELDELDGAIAGSHEHHPYLELVEIASMAVNCLRLFTDKSRLSIMVNDRLQKSKWQSGYFVKCCDCEAVAIVPRGRACPVGWGIAWRPDWVTYPSTGADGPFIACPEHADEGTGNI